MSVPSRIVLALALVSMLAVPMFASTASAAKHDPACSASPGAVGLDQSYTVSAWGLPGGTVNLIVTYPNGTTSTHPINVVSDGTFSLTQSSASAMPAEQTGTYGYQFVNRVSWPSGSFSKSFASCSVHVG